MPQQDYRRLGGWLLFFTVTLGLGLGMNVMSLLQVFAAGVQLDPIGFSLTCVCVVLQGVLLYQVLGRRPWYLQVLVALVVLLTLTDGYTLLRSGSFASLGLATLLGLVRNVIWLLYFYRSRRVAVYFGREAQFRGGSGPRRCPYCGNTVSDDAIFCGRCGRPLR